jgi:tRNA 2-thiouridine synthesizing protein A
LPAISIEIGMSMRQLDCRQLSCPMPIVHLAMAMKTMEIGEEVCVEATDAAFGEDLAAWARMSGNTIVDFDDGDPKRAIIRRLK